MIRPEPRAPRAISPLGAVMLMTASEPAIRRDTVKRCQRHRKVWPQAPADFVADAEAHGLAYAHRNLARDDRWLRLGGCKLSTLDDDELVYIADGKARHAQAAIARLGPERGLAYVRGLAREYDFRPPEDDVEALRKLADPRWWRRRVRCRARRASDQVHRRRGRVAARRQPYLSDTALAQAKAQRFRVRALLEALEAVNEEGFAATLAELSDRSVSNPANRRAELMVRLKGCEELARRLGHACVFLTITCPSRFHRYSGKRLNPRYSDETPREAQRYLRTQFARARAALHKAGLSPYGFRMVEPHHDGTPHWHLLLWGPRADLARVVQIVKRYALQDSPDEPGAQRYRFRAEWIDRSKGSAVGYVAKYIAKNIDGHKVGELKDQGEGTGVADATGAERITAWASTWGLRQFQAIGQPPVTLWRELRRRREAEPWWDPVLFTAWMAANEGDWWAFMHTLRHLEGRGRRLRVAHAGRLDHITGEIDFDGGPVLGIELWEGERCIELAPTRTTTWTIRRAGSRERDGPLDPCQ